MTSQIPLADASEHGRRGAEALRSRTQCRQQCPQCQGWFYRLAQHAGFCVPDCPPPGSVPHVPRGHRKCPCGRIVAKDAILCCRCSGDAAKVDRDVAAGRKK